VKNFVILCSGGGTCPPPLHPSSYAPGKEGKRIDSGIEGTHGLAAAYFDEIVDGSLVIGRVAQWLALLEFELGGPGSTPGSRHYSIG